MAGEPPEYPKRPKFFAHRFTRLLGKVCIGAEVGPDTCWLLTYVAHTEDAAGFRRPVSFFNEDLATRLGMSVSAMRRARDRAVKAGWLVHIEGVKRRAPQYFVTVPEWASGLDDAAGDEQPGELVAEDGQDIPRQSDAATDRKAAGKRQATDRKAAGNRQESGRQADNLLPYSGSYSKTPNTPEPGVGDSEPLPFVAPSDPDPGPADGGSFRPPRFEELRAAWNALGGGLPVVEHVSQTVRQMFSARGMSPLFCARWRDGLAAVARSPRCHGATGWTATLKWFLSEGSLESLLNGEFDPPASAPPGGKPDKRQAELDAAFAEDAERRRAG